MMPLNRAMGPLGRSWKTGPQEWWTNNGAVSTPIMAYRAISTPGSIWGGGPATLSESFANLPTPGTHDLSVYNLAPGFTSSIGWEFNGTFKGLATDDFGFDYVPLTIMACIVPTRTDGRFTIIDMGGKTGYFNVPSMEIGWAAGAVSNALVEITPAVFESYSLDNAITLSAKQTVAVVRSAVGAYLKVYVNGIDVTNTNLATTQLANTSSRKYIGIRATNSQYFSGSISSACVWQAAFSAANIAAMHTVMMAL